MRCDRRISFFVCLAWFFFTHFLVHERSCVHSMIGRRSFGFVSLLEPANAIKNPGCVPFNHSSFLVGNRALSQFRAPLHRSPLDSAMPLQTSSGGPSFMRAVHGASCLHSCGRVAHRQAFGINLFLVFASHLCMWCWHLD